MDHATRRERLAAQLDELGARAFLITRLPNVRYLTGFTGSNAQVLVVPNGGVFLTDGRYAEQSRHEVPDLRRSIYPGNFPQHFAQACRDLGVTRVAFEAASLTFQEHADLGSTGIELVPSKDRVERLRWVKDGAELDALRAAQAIADEAFELITAKLVEGVTEQEAALELDTTMRHLGAEALAFDTIMAFGESAAEPHHSPTRRTLAAGDVVKIDFGCVVGGYNSDMTRTLSFGDPDPRLREVYQVVRAAQQAGVDAVRPGATGDDLDRLVRSVIQDAGYGDGIKHSLGHGVGLEIHEGPWLRLGVSDPLPEGAVVTVEPGVYLEGVGGVRIEDMVEVISEGSRVIPRTSKELMVL